MTIEFNNEVKRKEESRKIVNTIIDYGVTDSQIIDIMYFLALTLEDGKNFKEITSFLKKFKTNINKDEEDTNIVNSNKILT